MAKRDTVAAVLFLLGWLVGCGTVSGPHATPRTPGEFEACSDHYVKCRDRCAPREVEEANCYRDQEGRTYRICECKETMNPDTLPSLK